MWLKILLCTFFVTETLWAEDLFEDDVSFEFDPNFEDDFFEMGQSLLPGAMRENSKFESRDIVRHENSVSLFAGNETIASKYYLNLFPQGHFKTTYVSGHLGIPLRFAVYDNYSGSGRASGFVPLSSFILPKPNDFQSFWDAQRLVRDLEIFSPNDPHFFRLSRSHRTMFAQGELLNLDPGGLYDQDHLFFLGASEIGHSRTQVFLGPLALAHIMGVSSSFSPLTSVSKNPFVQNLRFEISYINDFFAPNQAHKQGEKFIIEEKRQVKRDYNTAQALALGVAGEYYPFSWLKLKPYSTLGQMWLTGLKTYGAGLHLGHDTVVDFIPGSNKSILVLKTEGRLFSQYYWPTYFGPTYMIDRVQQDSSNEKLPLTKSQVLASFNDGTRLGYLLGLAYSYDDWLSTSVSYENAHSISNLISVAPMRKMQFVTTFKGFDRLSLQLGYQATSIRQIEQLFDFSKSRGLLSLRGQLKFFEYLYLDTWAKHSFGVKDMFAQSEELWLSNLAEGPSLNFGLGLELSMTF